MTADILVGPVVYFVVGGLLIAVGATRWVGWRKSWYTNPGLRERRFQWIFGKSPLPFIMIGAPFILVDAAIVSLVASPALSIAIAVIAVLSAICGVIVVVARPQWSIPRWARSQPRP